MEAMRLTCLDNMIVIKYLGGRVEIKMSVWTCFSVSLHCIEMQKRRDGSNNEDMLMMLNLLTCFLLFMS